MNLCKGCWPKNRCLRNPNGSIRILWFKTCSDLANMLRLRLQRTFLHQFHNFNIVSTSHITERRIKNQPCTSAAEAICLGGGRGRSNCDLLPIWGWWRWQKHLEYLGISWNAWEFGIFLKFFSRFFMQRLGSGKVSSPWNWWVDYLLTHSNWLWVVEFQGIVFSYPFIYQSI